jgi:hypothetical protein
VLLEQGACHDLSKLTATAVPTLKSPHNIILLHKLIVFYLVNKLPVFYRPEYSLPFLKVIQTVHFLNSISLFTNKIHYLSKRTITGLLGWHRIAETCTGNNPVIVFLINYYILLVNTDILLIAVFTRACNFSLSSGNKSSKNPLIIIKT